MGLFTKKEKALSVEPETIVNKEFPYADKTQQLIRANRFTAIANTVYYVYIAFLLFVSALRGT